MKDADNALVHGEVWAGAGTTALRPRYESYPKVRWMVKRYMTKYSYADCLDSDGRAVKEFIRRFGLYKEMLTR